MGLYDQPAWTPGPAVLNELPIPPYGRQVRDPAQRRCRARIVWEDGTVEWVETTRRAWSDGGVIQVALEGRGRSVQAVWLAGEDVEPVA